jgi:excisionase family DNA binding protein
MTELLTPEELAAYLKIPVRTIYDWRTRQYGPPARKIGKHLRYRKADVEMWVQNPHPSTSAIPEIPRQRAPKRKSPAK